MYLLVAYKPDSDDYCKGCHMASYSSDFVRHNHLSREELIQKWGELIAKNKQLECNEAGYDFYIYEDGVEVWEEYGATCDKNDPEDVDGVHYDAIRLNIEAIHSEALSVGCKLVRDKQEREKMEKEIAEAKRLRQEREQRRQHYETLKKEFE